MSETESTPTTQSETKPAAESMDELTARAEALASVLRGASVELDVTTVSGHAYVGRRLDDITLEPRRDLVTGWDPRLQAVRSFRLSRVTRMTPLGGGRS